MDKDASPAVAVHPPLERVESHAWSVGEVAEAYEREDHESDHKGSDHDETGNDLKPQLSRVSTGPPYTIFGQKAKLFIVMSVSVSSLISPFGATTFYPALNVLARQLNVTPTQINLALTTYMVWSPLTSS